MLQKGISIIFIILFTFLLNVCNKNSVSSNSDEELEISWTNLSEPFRTSYDNHNRPWLLSDSNDYRIMKFWYCGVKICSYTAYVRFKNESVSGTLNIEACIRMDTQDEYMKTSKNFQIESGKSYQLKFGGDMKYSYLNNSTVVVSSSAAESEWTLKLIDIHISPDTGIGDMTLIEVE